MPNFYRTALGQKIDIDRMRVINEKSIAIGNMQVNARGDQIAPNGEIVKTRSEIMKAHYTQPVVKYTPKQKQPSKPAGAAVTRSAPTAEVTTSVPINRAPVDSVGPEHQLARPVSNDVRGSLASEVSVDLTDYKPKTPKTVKRI